jgi:hypothetical protein
VLPSRNDRLFKTKGKTVYEVLLDIYKEFGCYQEKLISLTKKERLVPKKFRP